MKATLTERMLKGAQGVLAVMLFALLAVFMMPARAFASYTTVTDEYPATQDLGSYGDVIYPSEIPDGTYSVIARTTSRMCILYENNGDAESNANKERCFIQVSGGQMIAAFYISKAYTRLYMGTAEEAASLTNKDGTDDSAYLVGEPADGYVPHRFVIAIPALNYPIVMATFAGGNYPLESTQAKWLTRQVVFSPGPDLLKAIEDAKKAPLADKTNLVATYSNAQNDYAATAVSVDGKDVAAGALWVPQSAKDALASALASARAIANDDASTQDQVDAATAALQAAVAAFDRAKALGTYVQEQKDDKPAQQQEQQKLESSSQTPIGEATEQPGTKPPSNSENAANSNDNAATQAATANANAGTGNNDASQAQPADEQSAQEPQAAQATSTATPAPITQRHGVLLSPTSLTDRLEDGEAAGGQDEEESTPSGGLALEHMLGLGVAGLLLVGIAARSVMFSFARRKGASNG